jgi:hemoglobin-like flavoprotein
MSPEQIRSVQASWQQVLPIRAAAADLFYARLFELAPEVRPLFKRDIHVQGAMLMSTLAAIVDNIAHLDRVLPGATALARRHLDYGVQPAHYDSVGQALLWTLEQGLGADFTPPVREAWAAAYGALASAMKAAAWPAGSGPQDPGATGTHPPMPAPTPATGGTPDDLTLETSA